MNNMSKKSKFKNQGLDILDWFLSSRIEVDYSDGVFGGDILEMDESISDKSEILITTQHWNKESDNPYVMVNFIDKVVGPSEMVKAVLDLMAYNELPSIYPNCDVDFIGGNELTISFCDNDDIGGNTFDIECVILYNKRHNAHEGWKFEI